MASPITVRFTEEELERVRAAATITGVSISSYIREKVFQEKGPGRGNSDWLLDDMSQTLSSAAIDLDMIKSLLLYIFGKQISSAELIRLKKLPVSNYIDTLEKGIADLCQTIINESE